MLSHNRHRSSGQLTGPHKAPLNLVIGPAVEATMVWPFSSKKPRHEEPKPEPPSNWFAGLAQDNPELVAKAKAWAPWAIIGLGTAGAIYHRYLRRIPGAAYIKQSYFRKRSIFGRATRVGDGDNFHMYHTPGGRTFGWGWLRRVPRNKKELKDKTVSLPTYHSFSPGQLTSPRFLSD